MAALRAAALLATAAVASAGLGPGSKEWQVDTPENHGLDSAKLKAAAELTAKIAPERYCLLVIKDGYLIHESYFGNTSESLYETDSLGKTVTAALFGSAVQDGLIDIDKPLVEYGVKPTTNFEYGHSWGKFFPNVTTRTLLAQSSGYGVVEPGSEFTYDSEEYIQHLSYALAAVVQKKNETALSYAQKWAKTMGSECAPLSPFPPPSSSRLLAGRIADSSGSCCRRCSGWLLRFRSDRGRPGRTDTDLSRWRSDGDLP